MPQTPIAHATTQPRSLSDLFWSFSVLALQGFGGVLAVVQRELVEKKRWMTLDEFADDWAVAQVLPGPNVVNLSLMIGGRYFGWRGALVSLAGILLFPTFIVLILAVLFAGIADQASARGALRGLAAVSAGLIAATGLKLVPAMKKNAMGRLGCALVGATTFVAIAYLRLPLAWVLSGLGLPAAVWAWYRLGRA